MHLLSDYQKDFLETYCLNVGDTLLHIRIPSFKFISMLHNDFIESNSFLSIYKAIKMLYVETPDEVFAAFSKTLPEPIDDFSSYNDLVLEEISHSTYKLLMSSIIGNSFNYVSLFKKTFSDIENITKSNLENAYRDIKIFLVKNFGYTYQDVQTLPFDSLFDIFFNEVTIHGDTSMFVYLFQRLVVSFEELQSIYSKDEIDSFCKNVLLKFQKFSSDCYNDSIRNELDELLRKFRIPYSINGEFVEYTSDGSVKMNTDFVLPDSISAEDFLKNLNK